MEKEQVMELKKIVIAGGTGNLGNIVTRHFANTATQVVVLSRKPHATYANIEYVQWDGKHLGDWVTVLEDADAVFNFSGKSVDCRYNEANKRAIISSRTDSTRAIGGAIQTCKKPPKVWINAGSAAIFGETNAQKVTEADPVADGFSPGVCKQWEHAFGKVATPKTRKIMLRIGMVLTRDGGVIKPLLNLVKLGLGGTIGSGKQYMTWIHEIDFLRALLWCIKQPEEGTLHCTSPNAVSNREFMRALRQAMGKTIGIPTPAPLVRIGAWFMGTEPELILKGRRVQPAILLDHGFTFRFPELNHAVKQLLA